MKSAILWALVIINAVLLAAFLGRLLQPSTAIAQQAVNRRPGDYLMVPAEFIGLSQGVVVVVDQINGELSALTFDDSQRRFDMMTKVDLAAVFQEASQRSGR